jgi:copper(I)-binding protein
MGQSRSRMPLVASCLIAVLAGCGGESVEAAADANALAERGGIVVMNGYAPEPVTPEVAALYFSLRNTGTEADRLLAVAADVAGEAQLHAQRREDGMMRMEPIASLEIRPGAVTALAPGGNHVMLTTFRRHYAVGDSLRVVITLERAGQMAFSVPVIAYEDVEAMAETGPP